MCGAGGSPRKDSSVVGTTEWGSRARTTWDRDVCEGGHAHDALLQPRCLARLRPRCLALFRPRNLGLATQRGASSAGRQVTLARKSVDRKGVAILGSS
jgi:hypothetical protein